MYICRGPLCYAIFHDTCRRLNEKCPNCKVGIRLKVRNHSEDEDQLNSSGKRRERGASIWTVGAGAALRDDERLREQMALQELNQHNLTPSLSSLSSLSSPSKHENNTEITASGITDISNRPSRSRTSSETQAVHSSDYPTPQWMAGAGEGGETSKEMSVMSPSSPSLSRVSRSNSKTTSLLHVSPTLSSQDMLNTDTDQVVELDEKQAKLALDDEQSKLLTEKARFVGVAEDQEEGPSLGDVFEAFLTKGFFGPSLGW